MSKSDEGTAPAPVFKFELDESLGRGKAGVWKLPETECHVTQNVNLC